MRRANFSVIFLGLACVFAHPSYANQTLEEKQKALNLIADYAERICTKPPLTGSGGDLSVEGKAELEGLFKKMVDLGVKVGGAYESYEGLLRADLLGALKHVTDCRFKVSESLKDKLLLPATSDTAPPPSAGQEKEVNEAGAENRAPSPQQALLRIRLLLTKIQGIERTPSKYAKQPHQFFEFIPEHCQLVVTDTNFEPDDPATRLWINLSNVAIAQNCDLLSGFVEGCSVEIHALDGKSIKRSNNSQLKHHRFWRLSRFGEEDSVSVAEHLTEIQSLCQYLKQDG